VRLRLRGLPFEASEGDVADFLAGYGWTPGTLQLLDDPRGRPKGEALVAFASRPEAERALRDLQHKNMGRRYIELFFA
jgi:hypothetical protein